MVSQCPSWGRLNLRSQLPSCSGGSKIWVRMGAGSRGAHRCGLTALTKPSLGHPVPRRFRGSGGSRHDGPTHMLAAGLSPPVAATWAPPGSCAHPVPTQAVLPTKHTRPHFSGHGPAGPCSGKPLGAPDSRPAPSWPGLLVMGVPREDGSSRGPHSRPPRVPVCLMPTKLSVRGGAVGPGNGATWTWEGLIFLEFRNPPGAQPALRGLSLFSGSPHSPPWARQPEAACWSSRTAFSSCRVHSPSAGHQS